MPQLIIPERCENLTFDEEKEFMDFKVTCIGGVMAAKESEDSKAILIAWLILFSTLIETTWWKKNEKMREAFQEKAEAYKEQLLPYKHEDPTKPTVINILLITIDELLEKISKLDDNYD